LGFPVHNLSDLSASGAGVAGMGIDLDTSVAKTIADETNAMMAAVAKLAEAATREEFASTDEHMQYCATVICALMDEVRLHADALEAEISDEQWPLPKYREMLFIK
jgi:glutamine synthetase